jgi:hypothetical protein
VTAALDFLYPAPAVPALEAPGDGRPTLHVVPSEHIPLQPTPAITISLTEGCDVPLDALRSAPERMVCCHPYDEAVVQLLLLRLRRTEAAVLISPDVTPGTLQLT